MVSLTVEQFLGPLGLGKVRPSSILEGYHYAGQAGLDKLQKRLWSFQAPDGVYKAERREHDPAKMDEVMEDQEAATIILAIVDNARTDIMKTVIGNCFNLEEMTVDELVKEAVRGQWLGDKLIAEKLLEKAERFMTPLFVEASPVA